MNAAIQQASVVLSAVVLLTSATGCYRTRTATMARPTTPEYEQRQWFLIAGLVPLSSAGGSECGGAGMATSDSRLGGWDIVINVGLAVAGGLLGASVCSLPDNATNAEQTAYGSCVSGMASLVPFIIGSRTVSYTCAGQ